METTAKEEEKRAEKQRKKKFDDEMKLQKTKLEQKLKYEKKIDEKKDQNINAKLPKLVITKFKGTPKETKQAESLRFSRVLFGLSTSPFHLGGVIDQHLRNLQQNFPNEVEEVKRSLHVDDLITGVTTVVEKKAAQAIFREGRFQLHKWHSNLPSLEEPPSSEKVAEENSTTQQEASHSLATPAEETAGQQLTTVLDTDQIFAKYHVGVKTWETKLLGAPWNKTVDSIKVAFPAPIVKVTKIEILRKISKIYDHLGLASPVTLAGKMLYREICDARVPWDRDLPREVKNTWENWERMLTRKVEFQRSLVEYREEILSIDLHAD